MEVKPFHSGCYPDDGYHFFFSSFSTWHTNVDFEKGMKTFMKAFRSDVKGLAIKRGSIHYINVWYVPVSETEHYAIRNYSPVVDGKEFIGCFPFAW